MDILAAIKREERRIEKQLGKLNHQLSGVRAAAKVLGGSAEREVGGVKKRVLSAAGRAAIARAAKKRGRRLGIRRRRRRDNLECCHFPSRLTIGISSLDKHQGRIRRSAFAPSLN